MRLFVTFVRKHGITIAKHVGIQGIILAVMAGAYYSLYHMFGYMLGYEKASGEHYTIAMALTFWTCAAATVACTVTGAGWGSKAIVTFLRRYFVPLHMSFSFLVAIVGTGVIGLTTRDDIMFEHIILFIWFGGLTWIGTVWMAVISLLDTAGKPGLRKNIGETCA